MPALQITYIGQATTLINLGGQSFLANPNFSKKNLLGTRVKEPGVAPASLPKLSAVLVTDADYDHLDLFSYKFFPSTLPIVAPQGLGKFIGKFLPNPVTEIPPWSYHLHGEVEIHAVPARYFGYRWLPVRHRAACAYVLKSPLGTAYFSGGTAYAEYFKEIASIYDVDAAVFPVGPELLGWWEKKRRMTPEEALQALADLRAGYFFPLYEDSIKTWGTRGLPSPEGLKRLVSEKNLCSKVVFLEPGAAFKLPEN